MVTWFDGSKGGLSPVTAPGAVTTDGWIPWAGEGLPPVGLGEVLEYELEGGQRYTDVACDVEWGLEGVGYRVVAYRRTTALKPIAPGTWVDGELHVNGVALSAIADRYPPPAEAELVTLWKKNRRVVMSITADGKTQDFYMPPARLVYLLREVAEQLAENAIIQ